MIVFNVIDRSVSCYYAVMMFVDDDDAGTVAGQAHAIGATTNNAQFVMDINATTFGTFTHELGHLIGMAHDNDNTGDYILILVVMWMQLITFAQLWL